jgi:hypothetical protein
VKNWISTRLLANRSANESTRLDEPYYPWEALIPVRDARHDPAAAFGLELCSGRLVWWDENYPEFAAGCRGRGNNHHPEPLAFRASLILGRPREDCRRGWEDLRRPVPQWPGFRPERCSESLCAALDEALAAED